MLEQASYDELFERASNEVQNRFLLSILLAKRVNQLRNGAEPLVETKKSDTKEEIVFREIIEGKLEWTDTSNESGEALLDENSVELNTQD
ncbi:MAG: DNA-directed RNA polymerase subunit omega [Nitrospinota bacterium]|nr:DNA-directed RNA polymerase subunit omega [Nitrospinota bacterium]